MALQIKDESYVLNTDANKLALSRFSLINPEGIRREVLERIPTISTNRHTGSMRYHKVNTLRVIDRLMRDRWYVVQVSQCAVRKGSKVHNAGNLPDKIDADREFHRRAGCQKHMVVLRNERYRGDGITRPQLVIATSHDISFALRMMLGFRVFACDNDTVYSSDDFGFNQRRIHSAGIETWLDYKLESIQHSIDHGHNSIERMRHRYISLDEQYSMATKFIDLVRPNLNLYDPFRVKAQLVRNRYSTQSSNSIWDTYQTLQRHMIKGNWHYLAKSDDMSKPRTVRARPLTGPRTIELDRKMWQIAESYI